MFSSGQIAFAISFFVVFVIAIIWAYRKDKIVNTAYFKDSYKVLLFIIFVFLALYMVVKLKRIYFP